MAVRTSIFIAAVLSLLCCRPPAAAEPVRVVATFSVLGDMVSAVAADRVALVTIVGGDGDTELYKPTAADARALADAYIAQIHELDAWARKELAEVPKPKRKVITSHDGFEYLAKAYGIRIIPARGWTNDKEASAADVARLMKQIRRDKIKAVFVENMNDPRVIERVARETGAEIGGTLYSDALSKPNGEAGTYLAMFRHNIAVLKAGMLKN